MATVGACDAALSSSSSKRARSEEEPPRRETFVTVLNVDVPGDLSNLHPTKLMLAECPEAVREAATAFFTKTAPYLRIAFDEEDISVDDADTRVLAAHIRTLTLEELPEVALGDDGSIGTVAVITVC